MFYDLLFVIFLFFSPYFFYRATYIRLEYRAQGRTELILWPVIFNLALGVLNFNVGFHHFVSYGKGSLLAIFGILAMYFLGSSIAAWRFQKNSKETNKNNN
ncbi:MAG: hypothetical protein HYW78_03165 [Parcubacteria group bacterium]|nr:hypothetical protein [Parcubacteria group bacterium]